MLKKCHKINISRLLFLLMIALCSASCTTTHVRITDVQQPVQKMAKPSLPPAEKENAKENEDVPIWFEYPEQAWNRPENIDTYFIAKVETEERDDDEGRCIALADISGKAFVHVKNSYEREQEWKFVEKIVEMDAYVKKHSYIGTNILLFDCVPEKIRDYYDNNKLKKYYSLWAIKKEKVLDAIKLAAENNWISPEVSPEDHFIIAGGTGAPRRGETNPVLQKESARDSAMMEAEANLLKIIKGASFEDIKIRNRNGEITDERTVEKLHGTIKFAKVVPGSEKWKNGIYSLKMQIPLEKIKEIEKLND